MEQMAAEFGNMLEETLKKMTDRIEISSKSYDEEEEVNWCKSQSTKATNELICRAEKKMKMMMAATTCDMWLCDYLLI